MRNNFKWGSGEDGNGAFQKVEDFFGDKRALKEIFEKKINEACEGSMKK